MSSLRYTVMAFSGAQDMATRSPGTTLDTSMFWEVIDPTFSPDSFLVETEGHALWQAETRQHNFIEGLQQAWNIMGIITQTTVRETEGI